MKSIEHLIGTNATIDVPRGFLKTTFELSTSGEVVARLAWDERPPGRAYLDTAGVRYELCVVARSQFTRRRTVQARCGGEVVAELHSGWRGGDGDVITSVGRRYLFRSENRCYTLEREVGHERVCHISRRRFRRGRQIHLTAGSASTEDVVAVVATLLFHVLAMDYASDWRMMAAGGAAGS